MSNRPIAPIDTPDPWILHHNNTFYFTFTLGDRVEIWSSPTLEDFHSPTHTRKSVVWKPAADEHWSSDLWAPELHLLPSSSSSSETWAWYIYFCACPRATGNPGHRTVILKSTRADPMDPSGWAFLGPLRGVPDHQWAIDATVFMLPSSSSSSKEGGTDLYCCYSGWPLGDHSDTQQDLFLVRLESPEVARPETLTCISRASLPWERPDAGRRGVNEGPSFINIPPDPGAGLPHGFKGIVYSAHGSWGHEYKLAVLALVAAPGVEVCDERSWVKREHPLLVSDERFGAPFGPGHASFVLFDRVPTGLGGGGKRVFCVYHGTAGVADGWANRKARVLELHVSAFGPAAATVCCAAGANGGGVGGYQNQNMNVNQSGSVGGGGASPSAHTSATGDKIWKEVEKRVPGQYKGYLDKVKKFF